MMRAFLALTLLATVVVTISAQAQSPPAARTSYDFLGAVIGSLAQTHDAVTAINEQKKGDFFGQMVAVKNANIEFDIASRRLQPFVNSRDENVKSASDGIVSAFGYVRESFAIQLTVLERANAATSAEQLTALRGSMSDAAVMYQQGSKLLLDATALAVGSAAVADPKDVNHIALAMSADEKAALIKILKSRFGGKLASTDGDTGPMTAAKVILNSLDQQWRLAK